MSVAESATENEATIEQIISDESQQVDWKPELLKPKPKRYHKKFCEKWLQIFRPWLSRSPNDPDKPYCRVCQTQLNSNRNHLARHATASKHQRNMATLPEDGEGVGDERNYNVITRKPYIRRNKVNVASKRRVTRTPRSEIMTVDYKPHITSSANEEYSQLIEEVVEDEGEKEPPVPLPLTRPQKDIVTSVKITKSVDFPCKLSEQQGCQALPDITKIMQETQNRAEEILEQCATLASKAELNNAHLADAFKKIMQVQQTAKAYKNESLSVASGYDPKHPVDLFFQSACSTVKSLSPKLMAEAKMRFSNILCELELRNLSENSNGNDGSMLGVSTVVFSNESSSYVVNPGSIHDGTRDMIQEI